MCTKLARGTSGPLRATKAPIPARLRGSIAARHAGELRGRWLRRADGEQAAKPGKHIRLGRQLNAQLLAHYWPLSAGRSFLPCSHLSMLNGATWKAGSAGTSMPARPSCTSQDDAQIRLQPYPNAPDGRSGKDKEKGLKEGLCFYLSCLRY